MTLQGGNVLQPWLGATGSLMLLPGPRRHRNWDTTLNYEVLCPMFAIRLGVPDSVPSLRCREQYHEICLGHHRHSHLRFHHGRQDANAIMYAKEVA